MGIGILGVPYQQDNVLYVPQSKDASEVMEDPQGRWFPFVATSDSVLVLEKKSVPEHLQSLPCIDAPTPLGQVLRELEDGGEVGGWPMDVNHIVYQNVAIKCESTGGPQSTIVFQ